MVECGLVVARFLGILSRHHNKFHLLLGTTVLADFEIEKRATEAREVHSFLMRDFSAKTYNEVQDIMSGSNNHGLQKYIGEFPTK